MEIIHRSVTWYQQKIGSYDKQLWEQSVEQKVLKGIQQAPRRSVKPKTELIDVDLVRGSTFSKAKPQVPWTYITIKTFSRVVLFPCHYRWWIQQTSVPFWLFLMFLYCFQIFTICVFVCNVEDEVFSEEHSLSEVFIPCILMVLLGLIHSQTVLTHLKPPVRDNKREGWRRKRSLSQNRSGSDVLVNTGTIGSDGNGSQPKVTLKNPIGSRLLRERNKERKNRAKGAIHRSSFKADPLSQDSESAYHTFEESVVDRGSSADFDSIGSVSKRGDESLAGIIDVKNSSVVQRNGVDKHINVKNLRESQESDLPEDSNSDEDVEKTVTGDKDSSKRFSQSISSDNEIEIETINRVVEGDIKHLKDKCKDSDTDKEHNIVSITKTSLSSEKFTSDSVSNLCCAKDDQTSESNGVSELTVKMRFEGRSHLNKNVLEDVEKSGVVTGEKEVDLHKYVPKTSESGVRFNVSESETQSKVSDQSENKSIFKSLASRKKVKRKDTDQNTKIISGARVLSESKCDNAIHSTGSEFSSLSSVEREHSPVPAHIASYVHFTLDKQRDVTPRSSREGTPTHTQSDVILQAKHTRSGRNSKSSDSESEDNEKITKTLPNVRRRKVTLQDGIEVSGSILRNRRQPAPLGLRETKSSTTVVSSSEGETEGQSSEYSRESRRNLASSEEWGDHLQSGLDTSSESSSCGSEPEISAQEVPEPESENDVPASPQPHGVSASTAHVINLLHPSTSQSTTHSPPDKVTCIIWEGNECKKIELTAIDIGWAIIETVHKIPESSDYVLIGITFSILMGLTPLLYQSFHAKDISSIMTWNGLFEVMDVIIRNSWKENLIHLNGVIQRLCLSAIFFFMLSVADKTFKQRLLYAKHFCYLTSSRRARKFDMPHFRLNKVRNIRTWLSLRSYLKKRGPQRSVDVIVSSSFLITLIMLILICLQLLRDTEIYLNYLCNWELLAWCMALGVYLLRFMNLGLRINKKYRNLSVLITEQINLYLQMEQKPHKKEELMVANNVLKLAESLLKELESPFKISGISANPLVLNITRVVVLSAFSAVLTELLGFKLKLYKIKLRP